MNYFPFLFVAALYSLNPVTVSIYPSVSLPPATFRITVLTPRHADNRNLCLAYREVGAVDPIRKSCQSMDGANGSRVRTVYWDLRTAGEYEAVATLTRMEDGQERIYRTERPFRVVGIEP